MIYPNRRMRMAFAYVFSLLLAFSCAADDSTVFVTKSGAKYHTESCKALAKSKIAITLDDAIARGYGPCALCSPPVPDGQAGTVQTPSVEVRDAADTGGSYPYAIAGTVTSVTDGDTLVLSAADGERKIRLNGIDCPEHDQAYGDKAKAYAASLVLKKTVEVTITGRDRYGRYIGDVSAGGVSVNASLVEAGYAWHYKKYSTDERLAALEREARSAGRGLWQDANAIPPWDFRKR